MNENIGRLKSPYVFLFEVLFSIDDTYWCGQGGKGSDNFKPLPICINKKRDYTIYFLVNKVK